MVRGWPFKGRADSPSIPTAAEENLQEYKRILAAGGNLPHDPIRPAQNGQRATRENGSYGALGQTTGGEAMDVDQPDMPNMDDFDLRKARQSSQHRDVRRQSDQLPLWLASIRSRSSWSQRQRECQNDGSSVSIVLLIVS